MRIFSKVLNDIICIKKEIVRIIMRFKLKKKHVDKIILISLLITINTKIAVRFSYSIIRQRKAIKNKKLLLFCI